MVYNIDLKVRVRIGQRQSVCLSPQLLTDIQKFGRINEFENIYVSFSLQMQSYRKGK